VPYGRFPESGPLRDAYEAVDWAATPLGAPEGWSPTLRRALDLTWHTRFPVTLFWGPDGVMIYNEAYTALIADKHPAALGRPVREVFPEAWEVLGPMVAQVREGGGANWYEDLPLPLWRNGRLEECYFTFSFSPVRGDDGELQGVMDIATETSDEVIGRRRLELLGALRSALAELDDARQLAEHALPVLAADAADFAEVALRAPVPSDDGLLELPLSTRDPSGLVLAVRLSEHLAPDAAYLGFLSLVAQSLGQALDRAAVRDNDRRLSELLQRSLLTRPATPDGLEVAVRYRPAEQASKIGGDWYDSFLLPDGALALTVGDVAGHDRHAAVLMAQVRNILRGIAYALRKPPGQVLVELDSALADLAVEVSATAILARVEKTDQGRIVRWSNAGHPPPLVVTPEGAVRVLGTPPDPLLGVGVGARGDHTVPLPPGAAMVFYTDGVVERRGVALDERIAWLAALVAEHAPGGAEALCDAVVDGVEGRPDDDVAVMVLRAGD
jgi:serine phosphatase RsbU (regulator of sigma subunit)